MPDDRYARAPRLPEGAAIDPAALVPAATGPVELEIGPGRGWFLVERLAAVADAGLIGLEIRRKWATIVDDRLRARGLGGRGRVFAEDARTALPRLLPASLSTVFVHFPDPWWKKRHQKRLLITEGLIEQLARVLRPGGELFVQTDVAERADAYEEAIARSGRFVPVTADGPRVEDHPFVARSPRERRALADGVPIVRLRVRRVSEAAALGAAS
ncbi:MAG TPA: tRNA (guanine-N7)-methyltransferase [Polyangiaceae bacterium]|nr:tRNA (guanine-N7)-methyltransferase [Polyangiaceae bacterium]